MVLKPHTIPCHTIPYHTIPCHTIIPYHTIPSFQTCHRVSGVLFPKYENCFCRLQYWSIGLHFLWTSSSHFFWHCNLQVKAIGWTWSFENQLNWALSQVLAIHTLHSRLQYWSIGLHFLWTGSSHYFWKLPMQAIGWTWSFENQLNWAVSHVLAIYTQSQAT